MIFQTSTEGIRTFKCKVNISAITAVNQSSIVEVYDKQGFDISVSYNYSIDGNVYQPTNFTTLSDLLIHLINNQLLQTLANFDIYLSFTYAISQSETATDFSTFTLDSISFNGQKIFDFAVEIGRMFEQTIVRTSNNKILNPYKYNDNAKKLYEELSIGINQMFGFDVIYFRTESVNEKRSIVFKTYDLNNVISVKKFKLSIKDNEIPEALEKFDELGFDFQNELVVHIVKHEFEKVFGIGQKPNSNDYIYLPLTDKMYQLNAPYDPRTFMQFSPFWEIMTTKYDKRSVVVGHNDDELHKVDELIDFTSNYLIDEEQLELADAVKDYNLANNIKFSEENLEVTESIHKPFENGQLNLYSFSTINVKAGDVAKTYQFKQTYKDKLLMTCWFKLTNTLTTIFLLSDNNENHYVIAEYLKTENCLQLKFYQDQQQLRLISLSLTGFSKDDFIGFVMYDMSEIDNTVACMLINSNREVIVETIEPMQTSDKHFSKLSIYGQLYYSLLRVCIYPDLPENDFEELMFNNLLPKKKHIAIIDNATPSLTYDRFS